MFKIHLVLSIHIYLLYIYSFDLSAVLNMPCISKHKAHFTDIPRDFILFQYSLKYESKLHMGSVV
jgi:hypothetical protein